MWKGPLNKIDDYTYEIPDTYRGEKGDLRMRTSALIYASPDMIPAIRGDNAPEQIANVTTLPGIVGRALAMPEIHWGYGFPIGGVAATDAEEGVISPGGVGFDINCGVRLVRTGLRADELSPEQVRQLVDTMFVNVPSGVGSQAKVKLSKQQLEEVLRLGARWAVEQGYGWDRDLEVIEENGCMEAADPAHVSQKALERGKSQVGSLGAGNHFLEIQRVAEVYDREAARSYGIQEGQLTVMIHTGSRGFGHQVCTDHLRVLERAVHKYGISLPDRQLACAPATSDEAQSYFGAMACAANFAWCNRQMIVHWVRQSFEKVLGRSPEDLDMHIVYDVCHNTAKLEEHQVEGERRRVYVHRKGATRAFGPGREGVPETYREVGQPVIIPGDMGTESYLLKGTAESEKTFGSTCHGAGRTMSRSAATRKWRGEAVGEQLRKKGIYAHPASWKVMAEESPDAYKDVGQVVNVTHGAGISLKVARLVPLGVVKG
ncbi:MAG TPA: RtcB family protein [Thermoplasmatales archaeon]|nr:RtcB family protein [Thermoplasmatales archaeon]